MTIQQVASMFLHQDDFLTIQDFVKHYGTFGTGHTSSRQLVAAIQDEVEWLQWEVLDETEEDWRWIIKIMRILTDSPN